MAMPGERLQLRLDYQPDLFERATRGGHGGRLVRLLEAVVAEPERAIGSLDVLGARRAPHDSARLERHRARGLARPLCRSCSPRRSPSTPDAVAVVCEDAEPHATPSSMRAPTAGASPARSRRAARDRGRRSASSARPTMLVGLLGILKAGGAYLPLDPDYPRRAAGLHARGRRRAGAGDARGAARRLPAHGARIVRLDADWPAIAQQPSDGAGRRRSSRTTPPTSSTPRARPARPRAWWSTHARLCQQARGLARGLRGRRATAGRRCCIVQRASTLRSSRRCCR